WPRISYLPMRSVRRVGLFDSSAMANRSREGVSDVLFYPLFRSYVNNARQRLFYEKNPHTFCWPFVVQTLLMIRAVGAWHRERGPCHGQTWLLFERRNPSNDPRLDSAISDLRLCRHGRPWH